ncbi:Nicotinate-nucleotide pyrophosphorylase [carboxylating], chloroplastic [Glycine soja]
MAISCNKQEFLLRPVFHARESTTAFLPPLSLSLKLPPQSHSKVRRVVKMSATEVTSSRISYESFAIKPPEHPTYDLKGIIKLALEEDAGDRGDVTCLATIPFDMEVEAYFLAKEDGIIAGIALAEMIFHEVDPSLKVEWSKNDGDFVHKGLQFGRVHGRAHNIVVAERVVLNFMQRMSGTATLTKAMANAAYPAYMLETRKTAPGLRLVDKWAVLIGGGRNHRMGLFDMVMIKDNHISAAGGVADALKAVDLYLEQNNLQMEVEVISHLRTLLPFLPATFAVVTTEILVPTALVTVSGVETRTLEEVEEVLHYSSQTKTSLTRIMLDNMVVPLPNGDVDISMLKEAVQLINGRYETEASGNVTLDTVHKIGQSGVTYISSGSLTHSVKALDISLKIDTELALKVGRRTGRA